MGSENFCTLYASRQHKKLNLGWVEDNGAVNQLIKHSSPMQEMPHVGSCDKRNSQVRLHGTGRFLQNRAYCEKHESWNDMSRGSLWRLHSLLAATHGFPFMHYIKFLSRSAFCVWNRRGIAIELEKQILKLSNIRET